MAGPSKILLNVEIEKIVDRVSDSLRPFVRRSGHLFAPLLPPAAEALLAFALRKLFQNHVVWITDGPQTLETCQRDIQTLAGAAGLEFAVYPPLEEMEDAKKSASELPGLRTQTLMKLMEAPSSNRCVILTSIQAIMQPAPKPDRLLTSILMVRPGEMLDRDRLVHFAESAGYDITGEVQRKGQVAVRGGIVDIWPPTEPWPVRVEFAESSVESLRAFDPATQLSVGEAPAFTLVPAGENTASAGGDASLLSYLPHDVTLLWSDRPAIERMAAVCEEAAVESGSMCAHSFREIESRFVSELNARSIATSIAPEGENLVPLDIVPIEPAMTVGTDPFQPDIAEKARRRILSEISAGAASGATAILFLDTPVSLERLRSQFGDLIDGIPVGIGHLSGGFGSKSLGVTIACEADLYGRKKSLFRRTPFASGRAAREIQPDERVCSAEDLEEGDLVVHAQHGLGRFIGVRTIIFDGRPQEVLTVEYADNARLHVPVSQAHLLTRYVGFSGRPPPLHRLGGRRWNAERQAAEKAIADLAASLLETQARRMALPGTPFPPDHPWQKDFEAAFPFEETPDQRRAAEEIKCDMESPRPMDRLVCGDAGYGKTEVAMRAAFKAVIAGKQVAVLVPTTVLAQQHFETFTERMAAYPVRIEMLSRFVSRNRHPAVIEGLKSGAVDIVIGTHALLDPGISFRNLGLVIIDEEQRFGVVHKERLKQIRHTVDVLTLTATPIPRTLYLSLTGVRDMSLLQTPPRERLAVETIIARNTDAVVRQAILRELGREGQVFYLHNRVMTIELARKRLERIAPEARIAVAHGQMPSSSLSAVMRRFVAGEEDILLCTTIIESGLDIPRANTIIVDRADRFGIADLYQIRGRVGRSHHKGYAYFLIPATGIIDAAAQARLSSLQQHSDLGSGFPLAMRDLELRGAGNILGAAQSGHIAAIGFGLYCRLMRAAIARLKGEAPPVAVQTEILLDFLDRQAAQDAASQPSIPTSYVEEDRLRLSLYRRLAEACRLQEIDALSAEMRDRFGPQPAAVDMLLDLARLRIMAASKFVRKIETRDGKVFALRRAEYIKIGGRLPRIPSGNARQKLSWLIRFVESLPNSQESA